MAGEAEGGDVRVRGTFTVRGGEFTSPGIHWPVFDAEDSTRTRLAGISLL